MKVLPTLSVLTLSLVLSGPASAHAKAHGKRRPAHHPILSGFLVPQSRLRTDPLPKPSGHLKLFAINFRAPLEVDLYDQNGDFDTEALADLNHFWRCRRTGTEKPIDPHLFEILSLIQDHFDGKTIELVSGFRNQTRLTSYHFHGSASDIRIPGVNDNELHAFVATLDTGAMGLGLYPRGGFIHVDVRPESYRWIDYSPPGGDMGHPHHKKKHIPNT